MYHRVLQIFIATQDRHLEEALQAVPPLERFSHRFHCAPLADAAALRGCAVVILDFGTVPPESLEPLHAAKDPGAVVIGCLSAVSFAGLAKNVHLLDRVWAMPLDEDKVRSSFGEVLKLLKEREDALLTGKYLDTLIDSLPDLIWFKDARGAHLKVNETFCRTVNKTKAQIEGRGHYYIWDLEPDEYAQGEYICMESEEIVLNKKETCLFDETVKCGDELRKFKTYKSPIFDTDGEVIGTVGFAHDVTDLQNLIVELNILVESLPFAVVVTDKSRIITTVNQKFIDIFKMDRSELIGKVVDSFLSENKSTTRSGRWVIERDEESMLFLSKDRVLKMHEENLLDIFSVLAGHVYLYVDITLEHQYRNKLLIDANTDHLTKLNNRRSLHDFMRKTPCLPGSVLLLADLDKFKEVNDMHGHNEGDKVLVAFANLLLRMFPAESLFRLGGDEFAIILPTMETPGLAKQYADRLLTQFEECVARQFSYTDISVSIGIALDDKCSGDFGELFKKADMALYESKKSAKSAYTFWKAGH